MPKKLKILILLVLIIVLIPTIIMAAPPPGATTAPYTVSYSGKLADSGGTPITTGQNIRFSIWSDNDVDASDYLGTGAIDVSSTGYEGWQETHSITPDANGIFHVQLGSINTLPNFNSSNHLYVQIEVKPAGAPDTGYEVLDPDGNTANTTDRHAINSSMFAVNSDTVDNADTGTDPGNIPVLTPSGTLPISTIPGGTESDLFIIDFNNDATAADNIAIQFGELLGKILEYDLTNGYFNFNDSVNVTGDLSVTGSFTTTGGLDFSSATTFSIRETADVLTADCARVNEIILDTTANVIYKCTAIGTPGTWVPTGSNTSQAKSIYLQPEYPNATVFADLTDNKGKLESSFVDTDGQPGNENINFYQWTTRQSSMQDIDMIIRVDLPQGFQSFDTNPIEIDYKTFDTNTSNNKVDVFLEDTTGTSVSLNNSADLVSSTWNSSVITFNGVPTFTAGEAITLKIKLSANNAGTAQIGRIRLNIIST
ncbi:hypothetical protein GF340_00950 [Candidatus Peregrinibacteria bacterium]|nr:hypothetical protein [Candidatus Peregrinibacteria bacterium]